jgi:hypothetical protein
MSKEDERQFVEFVKSTGDVILLPNISSKKKFDPVEILPAPFSGKWWDYFSFFNQDISDNLRASYIKQQRYWSLDRSNSSLIEFFRSSVEHQLYYNRPLRDGRIWAEFTICEEELPDMVPKEPEFEKWYEKIARWIKRRYKCNEYYDYIGPGAQKLDLDKLSKIELCDRCERQVQYNEDEQTWTCKHCGMTTTPPTRAIRILAMDPESGELKPRTFKVRKGRL